MFYDVDSFLAGRQTLYGIELELGGAVAGQDVLHLQSRFGMDTLLGPSGCQGHWC
jgi:hypothetical protein